MGFFWIVGGFISNICWSYPKVNAIIIKIMIMIIIISIHQLNLWHARPYISTLYGPSHLSFPTTLWRGINVNSTLEMKKLKLKGIKRLVQVHAANTRQDQESNENSLVENIWGGNRTNWWLTELSCLCYIYFWRQWKVLAPLSWVPEFWSLFALQYQVCCASRHKHHLWDLFI